MMIKLFTSALLVFFLAACSTTPKDTSDSSGSGSSSTSSDVSSSEEGTITETSPESASIAPGSQEDLIGRGVWHAGLYLSAAPGFPYPRSADAGDSNAFALTESL